MTTAAFTRTVHGQQVPAPGTYAIDPVHSDFTFQVKHMGISKVRGSFTDIAGTVTVGETTADSSAQVTIQAASIDTAHAQRDAHLRSADFFDTDNYPTLEFRSTSLDLESEVWKVHGELTIVGTTRPVTLEVQFEGAGPDVLGNPEQPRAGFSASTKINREDFGITWNQALETGGWVVGKQITIGIDAEAVRQ